MARVVKPELPALLKLYHTQAYKQVIFRFTV